MVSSEGSFLKGVVWLIQILCMMLALLVLGSHGLFTAELQEEVSNVLNS